ncbi:MAG: PilZ domain-containing protein [Methylobacter sp.]|nr:PilZ domain-containing protein [Methylobacter sp.]
MYTANLLGARAAAQPVSESTLNLTERINMLEFDEKRNYIRMEIDCDITYRLADSDELHQGRCSSLSGAGVSFITNRYFDSGKAMEVNIIPKNAMAPPMTAFIEVVRSTQQDDGSYEVAATIKSIKGD